MKPLLLLQSIFTKKRFSSSEKERLREKLREREREREMAYAAAITLQRTLQDLLDSPRLSLVPPSPEIIEFAYRQLTLLREILKRLDQSSKSTSRSNVNALDSRIKEAVWKFEDLLESCVYNQILPQSKKSKSKANDLDAEIRMEEWKFDGLIESHIVYYWIHPHFELLEVNLQELGHEVDSFTKLLKELEEEYIYELDHPVPEEEEEEEEAAAAAFDVSDSGEKKFKMVGFSDLLRKIRLVLKEDRGLAILPLAGMAGIGKSAIAKEIFDDPLLFTDFNFECRAWVKIGRKCKLEKLKRDILIQLDPTMDPKVVEENEGRYLKEILETKRCLVVLDDIWDTDVWDHLKSCLPNKKSGSSRVLITTRLDHVAEYVYGNASWDRYKLELLDEDESWDLLRQRVFGDEEDCPHQLNKAGKMIAEKCDGLPLMIVTVADLLSKADDKSAEYWEEVAENKKSSIFMAAYDQIYEVLFPSYEYLPQHLKPCFLHVGVLPQKYEISRSKLFSMWIAEGFIALNIHKPVERCAHTYLGELIEHNVVMRCQESSNFAFRTGDDIKSCRLQSAFWYLCNREATKNKFLCVLSSHADGFQESLKNQRRLSFHNNILLGMNDVFESVEDACASTARSLLCYGPYHPYQVPICFKLRLVKVLDALQIRFYVFPIEVFQLLYLRYVALTYNGELPASISKLWNLRILIIHRNMSIKTSGVTSYMPMEIWYMKELKHVQVMGSNLPIPSSDDSLESLFTLKGVGAETCAKEVLERIPNVRKLGIQIELRPDDDMKALHCLDHIHVLRELTSLKCVVVNPMLRSETVSLPAPLPKFSSSLRKLHLSGLGYPWEYMSAIGSLSNLQVLKLRCYAFRGPKWEVEKGTFERLRYLLIEETDLVQLKVGDDGFSWLNWLRLRHCYKLKDLQWENPPPGKPGIEVIDCSPSTVTFANEARSRYDNYLKEHKKVYVHSSWLDGKLK